MIINTVFGKFLEHLTKTTKWTVIIKEEALHIKNISIEFEHLTALTAEEENTKLFSCTHKTLFTLAAA